MANFTTKLAVFGFGAISGSLTTYYIKDGLSAEPQKPTTPELPVEQPQGQKEVETIKKKPSSSLTTTPEGIYNPSHHWDHNWDHRQHYSNLKSEETGEPIKTTAVRNIILVRHGQYNLKGSTDFDRKLTELGIKQAQMTGKRLADLRLPLTSLISSNMTRAIETADIICQFLPDDLKVLESDSLLREGAPYPPEPPTRWVPEKGYHEDGARIEAAFRRYFYRPHPSQVSKLQLYNTPTKVFQTWGCFIVLVAASLHPKMHSSF